MQVIGFNLTKIAGEKKDSDIKKASVSTNIKFLDVQKESIELLKGAQALKMQFQYDVTYGNSEKKKEGKKGEILMQGNVLLKVDDTESKNLLKAWKKEQLPNEVKVPIYNLILKKCTPKAIALQDQIELPFHTPIPKLTPKN